MLSQEVRDQATFSTLCSFIEANFSERKMMSGAKPHFAPPGGSACRSFIILVMVVGGGLGWLIRSVRIQRM